MTGATFLDDFSASWSNRNGGEILVTVGSLRLTVSAAIARAVHGKLGKALGIPARAQALIDAAPVREPERIAAPDTMIAEPFRHRKGALIGAFPARAKRLAAIATAMEQGGAEGAELLMIVGIPFLRAEAEAMLAVSAAETIEGRAFEGSAFEGTLTIDCESEPGSYARHLRDTAAMRGEGTARA